MKTMLVLSILACVTAVQAGESCCDKSKAACCSSTKQVTKKVDTSVKGASQLLVRK